MSIISRSLQGALIGVLMQVGSAAVMAQDVKWNMHSIFPAPRAESQAGLRLAERVKARTNGKLEIAVHTGGSLGVKDVDMLRILPPGNVVHITLLYPGYVSRDAPDLAFAVPNEALPTWEDFVKIVPSLSDIYAKTYEKHGIKYLNSVLIPPRGIYIFCKQPIASLDELRKRKTRAWTKSLADTYAKLGVAANVIPQAEMYLALQTGVVDCATYTLDAVNTISMHEVAPYGARIAAYGGPINIVASKRAWDALPKDMQVIVQEEADRVFRESLDDFRNGTTENREAQKFLAAGGKLGEFPQKDRDEYLKAARDVWVGMTAQLGGATKQNAERIAKELGW